GCRPSRARERLLGVWQSQVHGLDELGRAEGGSELSVEARPRDVQRALARGNDGSAGLENLAVAEGAVANIDGARRDRELVWAQAGRLAADGREALAAPCVDDRLHARRPGGERMERRDAGDRDLEREREAARRREPDPHAGEAARAGADDDALQVGG